MSPLLAPIFAQLVNLELGDRTEARYAGYYGTKRAEATTTPRVGVNVTDRHTGFQISYAPSLTLSPLERKPRELYVFHQAGAAIGYRLRRTTLTLSGAFALGSRNLTLLGVQTEQIPNNSPSVPVPPNTTPPAGTPSTPSQPSGGSPTSPTTPTTPTTPTNVATQATDRKIRYYTWTTALTATHKVSREVQVTGSAGTTTARGLDDQSRVVIGDLQAYFVTVGSGYTYLLSKRDSFVSNVTLYETWSTNDYQATTGTASETWIHQFNRRTMAALGAGVNVTRFSQSNGLAGISIFPTFQSMLGHKEQLGRGTLSLLATAYSTPVMDPLRATVDPRVGVTGSVGYTRDKLTLLATANTAVSVAPNDKKASSVNGSQAEGRAVYQLGKLTAVDAGARVARQTYGGQTVVPLSWAVFVGLTVGANVPLFR